MKFKHFLEWFVVGFSITFGMCAATVLFELIADFIK